MLEYIYLTGLNNELIEELTNTLEHNEILSLACNHERVKSNIELLKSFGIKNIDDLLLNRNYLFLKSTEEIAKKFSKFNIPVITELINTDYTVIDEVFDY